MGAKSPTRPVHTHSQLHELVRLLRTFSPEAIAKMVDMHRPDHHGKCRTCRPNGITSGGGVGQCLTGKALQLLHQ
jgi:hypothetical protein